VGSFDETKGGVVLTSSSVARSNGHTQDGTWDKNDRKDAANCTGLLEQGKVLFYLQPSGPLADLRRLGTRPGVFTHCALLRQALADEVYCRARSLNRRQFSVSVLYCSTASSEMRWLKE